jgi:hypothetical protein
MTISIVRQQRVLQNGSEYFTIKLPSIAAGDFAIYDIDNSTELKAATKYKPLDFVEITNNDVSDIEICLDFQDTFLVPKGVIKTISDRPFYCIKVKNIGSGSTTADKVVLTLQRMPITTDQYIRKFRLGQRSIF